jgi:8-oxo-dGTP pyrophosphatase MutT (NUDIX family)
MRISAGFGNFPAANARPGETFEQCLVREIREELGVEISVGEFLRKSPTPIRKKPST